MTREKSKQRRTDTLADFFAASPLRNSGFVLQRVKNPPSPPDFGDEENEATDCEKDRN